MTPAKQNASRGGLASKTTEKEHYDADYAANVAVNQRPQKPEVTLESWASMAKPSRDRKPKRGWQRGRR